MIPLDRTVVIWILFALIFVAVVYRGIVALGAWRWKKATRFLVTQLDAAGVSSGMERYDVRAVAHLPAPVRRYFERALSYGQPVIRSVDLALDGMFNMSLDAPEWKPFTSTQHVVTHRPGFVWDARITLFPGVPVRVIDAYVAGQGILRPSILGLFPVGEISGAGMIAQGELMRWLAESVWYPTTLLPGQGVAWEAVDANSAQATLTDGPITLTMTFRFGEDGLVSGIRVESRGSLVNGKTVLMPWEGHFRDYRPLDGMMIPFYGEVAWITPRGAKPYFQGTVTHVTYEMAK